MSCSSRDRGDILHAALMTKSLIVYMAAVRCISRYIALAVTVGARIPLYLMVKNRHFGDKYTDTRSDLMWSPQQ
ncbi:unnamed protein product [Gongylonema pulchrum]|uniref:Secreted protein n=1 Tax=Gongylonema pulchrum TaxID=637853 RepID=A0A183DXS0_9BILA|nr:unnamed protein product [Gongylonema pulchrum]